MIPHSSTPRRVNSYKTDLAREMLTQLLGDVVRIELFARKSPHGLDV